MARLKTAFAGFRPAVIMKLPAKPPEAALEKMDKQRSTYYNYYTGKAWGKCDHYDLCVNFGRLGVDKSVELIMTYINALKK